MTKGMRRVAVAMFLLFGALFANLNYVQVLRADDLADDDRNARKLLREYETRRGAILAADGQTVLADSEETEGPLRFRRRYRQPERYAHVTGYHSVIHGRAEIERTFNDELAGHTPQAFRRNMAEFLAGRENTGDDVVSTIVPEVQQAAMDALGGRPGAIVALNPRTGAILALASTPTYNPDDLATHDSQQAGELMRRLQADESDPLINRTVREWYPPGSTFKMVTAAAGLERGLTPSSTFDDPARQPLPDTDRSIGNFGGGPCAGGGSITLERAFEVSCNTTFAKIGLDVGADGLMETAERFGFNARIIHQLPRPQDSLMPEMNRPETGMAGIGEFDVRATPLQMALVAAAIGNGGVLMEPRIASRVQDQRGEVLNEYGASALTPEGQADSQAVSSQTASALRNMMVRVVESGTGTGAQIGGVSVAGKTGTAQRREGQAGPTVWFAGFAPAEQPSVAVAVVFEEGGGQGGGATGGGVAAPVARDVMAAALDANGSTPPEDDDSE